jgi:outer membrane murein-binding lipoprotein Lpp
MTSPGILAAQSTHAATAVKRRHLLAELLGLGERLEAAAAERQAATHAANRARGLLDNQTAVLREHQAILPMLPPDPRRDERIAGDAAMVDDLRRAHLDARALAAAATVVEDALTMEVDWCRQRLLNLHRPAGIHHGQAEPVTGRAEEFVIATGYNVTLWRDDVEKGTRHLPQRKAVGLVNAWQRTGVPVLRDAAGGLFIASGQQAIELRPVTNLAARNEGRPMLAALGVYGWRAFSDRCDGRSFLALPLDPATPEAEAYAGPYLTIQSGEHATRPVQDHDEPWTLTPFDADGASGEPLYIGDPALSLAADSAACARAVVEFAAPRTAR